MSALEVENIDAVALARMSCVLDGATEFDSVTLSSVDTESGTELGSEVCWPTVSILDTGEPTSRLVPDDVLVVSVVDAVPPEDGLGFSARFFLLLMPVAFV